MTDLPAPWSTRLLGDIVDNKDAIRVPLKGSDREQRQGIYPYYGASGIIDYVDQFLFDGDYLLIGEDGANLLARSTPIAFMASGKFWVNNHAHILAPNGKADLGYLKHYLCSIDLAKFVTGTAQPKLTRANLDRIPIPLPPLAEQKRIAAILDKADGIRRKRREASALLDTMYHSAFVELFGDPVHNEKQWPRHKLANLVENIDSGWSPVCLDRPAGADEWGILKLGAVTYCRYRPLENKALPPELNPPAELEVKSGDLLMTRKNTYDLVAACAYVWDTPPRLLLPDLIFRFRLRSDAAVLPEYLWGLFTHPAKRRAVQLLAGGTAGSMPNISKGRLLTQEIEVPPLPLQQEYRRIVHSVRRMEAGLAEGQAGSVSLFDSLVQRAFRNNL